MSWKKKGCIFVAGVFAVVLIAGAIGVWYLDRQFGAVFAAPRVDHLQVTDRRPSIRFVVDPSKASSALRSVVNEMAGREVPPWLVDAFLPYEFSVVLDADRDNGKVYIDVLLNERRLGPVIETQLNANDILGRFPQINWDENQLAMRDRGHIGVQGSIPIGLEAQEEAFLRWSRTLVQAPPELQGGHFIEAVADNREGGAWLAGASIMDAYDYDLDEHAQEVANGVSLASFQFLTEIRLVADIVRDNAARFRLTLEVIPEHRNKLAVINIKVFLEDIFENLKKNFAEYHQIQFEGEARWEKTTLVFEYELGDIRQTLELIATGKLFQGVRQEQSTPTATTVRPR